MIPNQTSKVKQVKEFGITILSDAIENAADLQTDAVLSHKTAHATHFNAAIIPWITDQSIDRPVVDNTAAHTQ